MRGSRTVPGSVDPCIEVSWPFRYEPPEWLKRLKVRARQGACRVYLCGRLVASGCDEESVARLVEALRRETRGLVIVRYSWAERAARTMAGVVAWHGCRARLVEAEDVDWVEFVYNGRSYGEHLDWVIEDCRLGELGKALREDRVQVRPPLLPG